MPGVAGVNHRFVGGRKRIGKDADLDPALGQRDKPRGSPVARDEIRGDQIEGRPCLPEGSRHAGKQKELRSFRRGERLARGVEYESHVRPLEGKPVLQKVLEQRGIADAVDVRARIRIGTRSGEARLQRSGGAGRGRTDNEARRIGGGAVPVEVERPRNLLDDRTGEQDVPIGEAYAAADHEVFVTDVAPAHDA
jgi:hypothetical protein